MGASGAAHAPGFVPDPGPTAGTVKFLREDASFAQPTAAGVPNAADVTATNTFAPVQKFTNGIQIGTSPSVATIGWQSGVFLVDAVIGGTTPVGLAFEAFSTFAVGGFQSTTAEVVFVMDTQTGGNSYQGFSLVESNPSNFFSTSNTVECQIGAAKNATSGVIPPAGLAVGDVNISARLPILLAADPTVALGASTKQYVDNKFTSGFTGTVPLAKLTTGGANGSLTYANGILTAAVDPT